MSVHNEPPDQNFLKKLVALHVFAMFAVGMTFSLGEDLYHPGRPPIARLLTFAIGCFWGHVIFDMAWKAAMRSGRRGDDDDEVK